MTEKDYVTEDVARTLREKGFREKCRGYFYNGVFCFSCFHNEYNKTTSADALISAPSLAQAAKWLRNEHNIAICPIPYSSYWDYTIFDLKGFRDDDGNHKILGSRVAWSSYEEALNEGIKEALKMI